MFRRVIKKEAAARRSSKMETGNHFKTAMESRDHSNAANPKSLMSRGNKFCFSNEYWIFLKIVIVAVCIVSFSNELVRGQSANRNMLRELSKRDVKVHIITEAVDPAENSDQTLEYIEENEFPKLMKTIANLSYWRIVKNIDDAELVFVFTCYKIFEYDSFVARIKVFDNKMNFLYSPIYDLVAPYDRFTDGTSLTSFLKNANISKTSPFYVESKNVKTIDEVKFEKYYNLLLEAIEYQQNKKVLEYVDKCISINPELPILYEIKVATMFEMNKSPYFSIVKLKQLEPLNPKIVLFSQYDYCLRLIRSERSQAFWSAIGSSMMGLIDLSINLTKKVENLPYN